MAIVINNNASKRMVFHKECIRLSLSFKKIILDILRGVCRGLRHTGIPMMSQLQLYK